MLVVKYPLPTDMTEYLPYSHSYENAPKTKTKLRQCKISLPRLDGIMYILCSRKRSKSFTSNRGQKKRNISLTCAWFFWCSRQKGIKKELFVFNSQWVIHTRKGPLWICVIDQAGRYWSGATLVTMFCCCVFVDRAQKSVSIQTPYKKKKRTRPIASHFKPTSLVK